MNVKAAIDGCFVILEMETEHFLGMVEEIFFQEIENGVARECDPRPVFSERSYRIRACLNKEIVGFLKEYGFDRQQTETPKTHFTKAAAFMEKLLLATNGAFCKIGNEAAALMRIETELDEATELDLVLETLEKGD